jgi:hypothetical protein
VQLAKPPLPMLGQFLQHGFIAALIVEKYHREEWV